MSFYDAIEKFAEQYVKECSDESFLLDDIEEACRAELKPDGDDAEKLRSRLRNILDTMDTILRPHSSENYYLLEHFLRGTVFYCRPRAFEIQEGILVPGCRFEPFHPESLFYDDLEISAPEKIRTRSFSCSYGKVGELYYLLGPAVTLDILNAESEANYDRIMKAGGLREGVTVVQEVFDFSEFYRRWNFREGDEIRFTLDSYFNGQLRADYVARPDVPGVAETDRWLTEYESALGKVCQEFKDSFEIPMQLMYALLYAREYGRDVRKMPSPPIDMYQMLMRDIGFKRDGIEWSLESLADPEADAPVMPEETHDHSGSAEAAKEKNGPLTLEDFTISGGNMDSLQGILEETRAPVCEIELHAFMFDTLASGIDSFEEFSRTNSDLLDLAFADEAQKAAFLNFAEELWEETCDHYSMNLDSLKAPLRQRLVEKVRDRIRLAGEIASLNDGAFSKRFHGRMTESRRKIMETLGVLDADDGIPDEDAFGELEQRVGDLEADFELLADDITQAFSERNSK